MHGDHGVIDEVLIAPATRRLDDLRTLEHIFLGFEEQGIVMRLLVNFLPQSLSEVSFDEVGGMPMLTFSTAPRDELLLFVRRCADVLLALLLLVILSPVFAIVALFVKLTSHGPVLFRQPRCGLHGRPFTFLKFRSMQIDAEEMKPALAPFNEMDGPAFKMTNDPRVTPIGRFLRRTSLDELPQLWNILKGDMSFVGPRPAVIEEVRQYEPWQRRRLSMKPGLTCLWQVSGRNELTFEEWMRLDLEYIDNWSLWLDIKIALKTIPAVLARARRSLEFRSPIAGLDARQELVQLGDDLRRRFVDAVERHPRHLQAPPDASPAPAAPTPRTAAHRRACPCEMKTGSPFLRGMPSIQRCSSTNVGDSRISASSGCSLRNATSAATMPPCEKPPSITRCRRTARDDAGRRSADAPFRRPSPAPAAARGACPEARRRLSR